MAFDAYSAGQNEGKKESTVDWNALNEYVVEKAGLERRETMVGYVAGIVDLGTQEQEDAEVVFTGSEEDEASEIVEHPDTYFKDGVDDKGKPARLKCWPQKPIQSVTFAVDFPDVMLDKGQFFGEEGGDEKPLRLWYGGQFYLQDQGMVVGRPIPLRYSNIAAKGAKKPVWSFKPNHTLYKMAVGAKLIEPGEVFTPKDIDKLIGKSLQFEAQVFFKEHKGKKYYNEYIKYLGGLGRKDTPFEPVTQPFLVQFNQRNDIASLAEVRNHVINTIKRAINFEGSAIQKDLSEAKPDKEQELPKETESKPVVKQAPAKKVVAPPADDFDDSEVPF